MGKHLQEQPGLPGMGLPSEDPLPERPATIGPASVSYGKAREILTKATGFLDAYAYTLNPYSGCTFSCSYCYAAFFTGSDLAQDTWGEWVKVKENAAALMERYPAGALDGSRIYMSSVTDAYQPVERRLGLTRRLLEILAERHRPKLVVQTRSPDVVRDCDLFRQIEQRGGRVRVNMTVTSDEEEVRRLFEPTCPPNSVRIKHIRDVKEAGVDACITMTPLLLIARPQMFVRWLLDSGVENFIVQPFHFSSGKFVANTRGPALDLMAKMLKCDRSSFHERYMEHYEEILELLMRHLPNLGQGKQGFAPPF